VFVLSDQFLSDSLQAIEPIDVEKLAQVKPGADAKAEPEYRRYQVTENGVSPRLVPGKSKTLVVGDSHEHGEDGHMAEDADIRSEMVKKRLRKMDLIKDRVVPPDYFGDGNPDTLLICWGSVRGAAVEAAEARSRDGRKTSVLHFSQVWPLIPEQFMDRIREAEKVVCVEQNATGQFARLLRQEAGIEIEKKILKFDGRAISPTFILRELGD
jgi:2-oxoglutarate ferredoxin oxidoreductase subunit alpha